MPIVEIKTFSGKVLYSSEALSIKECLVNAVNDMADLRGADLQGAYLQGAYLRGADLRGADPQGADLRGAYLQGADLQGADLQGADLQGAYLRGADLRGADLQGAYLRGADLRGADLQGADLRGADLRGADLRGADLQGADLQGADLRWKIKIEKQPIQIDALTYYVTIWDNHMQIGCEFHSIKDWWSFDAGRIQGMDNDAAAWWKKWKKPLKNICKAEGRGNF